MHSSGASLLFIVMYAHVLRALYYRSYRNVGAWITGMILFIMMMAAGFLGYILVWGQMCEQICKFRRLNIQQAIHRIKE
jgi:ubiquinol-cytochrome c reductase cytochrome b subunit